MKFKGNTNHGITLIALVITIIVMLILVAVTITMAVNGGLFGKAADAGRKTNEAVALEQELGSGIIRVGNKTYESIDAYLRNDPIDQGITIVETATLEIEAGYDAQTGTPVTKKLEPTLVGIKGTVTWKSNNKAVADVENTGLVTAIGAGTAEITASVTYRDVTFTDTCTVTVEEKIATISKEQHYVGCYADLDGNGIIEADKDGIIYADMAVGNTNGTQWANSDGSYTIPVEENKSSLKDYVISDAGVVGPFGTTPRKVIKLAENDETKNDRFYVMDLKDIDGQQNGTYYMWLDIDWSNMPPDNLTDTKFKSGYTNTRDMINFYKTYTKKSDSVIWGQIESKYNQGWFIPSKEEWSAFAQELRIDSNYSNYGLSLCYWSSSQFGASGAWKVNFGNGCVGWTAMDYEYFVRLSTTF